MQKRTVVTVTLDTWYDIHFTRLDADRAYSRSVSTRIQQVEDAGTSTEHLDPAGRDSGYLWRINSYWRYEHRNNGTLVEWESIALSRTIPFVVAWFVNPLVRRIARETVENMLVATRKAALAEHLQQPQAETDPWTPASSTLTIQAGKDCQGNKWPNSSKGYRGASSFLKAPGKAKATYEPSIRRCEAVSVTSGAAAQTTRYSCPPAS